MEKFSEFLKKHKLAVGGAVIGLVLLWLLRSGSSGSGSSSNAAQLAQIQAASNLQNAQIAGQVQAASISAQSQQNQAQIAANAQEAQTQAELQAQQDQTAAALTAHLYDTGSNNAIYQSEISAANEESLAYDELVKTLAPVALKTAQMGGRANSQTGEAELATIFGQGATATSTLNESLGAASIASTIANEKLTQSLISTGAGLIPGL